MSEPALSTPRTTTPARPAPATAAPVVLLVGSPNAGKTTLFNGLTGLRAKTANFPGTTVEHRTGRTRTGHREVELIDLPGLYALEASSAEERISRDALDGKLAGMPEPAAVVVLVDATHLERNLYLASQVIETGRPTVVALNMIDLAEREGLRIDARQLADALGCAVVPVVARTGRGLGELRRAIDAALDGAPATGRTPVPPSMCQCAGCPFAARFDWAEQIGRRCTTSGQAKPSPWTERIDRLVTHPVTGTLAFFGAMAGMFALIFWIARWPMDWIEAGFGAGADVAARLLPAGDLQSLVVEGIIGGVGGVLVFLPQIVILFFFLSLLEDTGYLARAAFVMDRLMRRVGLPGKAFVPMLSAHACAIPGIMSARVIDDRRDRLLTILVLPLLSCSARIPVYAMVTALLFPRRPLLAGLLFTGAYVAGIVAALVVALLYKRTLLPGESRPLVLELPSYKRPSLRTAAFAAFDRGRLFLRKAGTLILLISVVLWALATYPRSEPPAEASGLVAQAAAARQGGDAALAAELEARAATLTSKNRLAYSFAGRAGRAIEPVFEPLGFDWQIAVGVLSSFAAREVIVSTLAIVYGVGEEAAGESPASLSETLRQAERSDGSPVFTGATSISLLIFYVLAMQCLPTQAVVRRETGGWGWPAVQFVVMTLLAYSAALVAFQGLSRLGF